MHHPGQQANEKWVGNTGSAMPTRLSGFATARLGGIAYDIEGKRIPSEQMLPLFIGNAELERYNDVMMTETFGPHWRQNR